MLVASTEVPVAQLNERSVESTGAGVWRERREVRGESGKKCDGQGCGERGER